jgi:hypothetical protein
MSVMDTVSYSFGQWPKVSAVARSLVTPSCRQSGLGQAQPAVATGFSWSGP